VSSFRNGSIEIAYLDGGGDGESIVLIHGFASTKEASWVESGWVRALLAAGRRVVALDNRGHGDSTKLYDPTAYDRVQMAEDVRALLDHLRIERADVMGYSMGSRIAVNLVAAHPDRVRSAVLGGIGIGILRSGGLSLATAEALEAPTASAVRDREGRRLRAFAEESQSDLRALGACVRGGSAFEEGQLARINVPTLVAVGTRDTLAGSPYELAALIPGARVLDIPDRDHTHAASDASFVAGVLAFLNARR
jgi:pimeloyl-ACP methyl ester carboxylesterase